MSISASRRRFPDEGLHKTRGRETENQVIAIAPRVHINSQWPFVAKWHQTARRFSSNEGSQPSRAATSRMTLSIAPVEVRSAEAARIIRAR